HPASRTTAAARPDRLVRRCSRESQDLGRASRGRGRSWAADVEWVRTVPGPLLVLEVLAPVVVIVVSVVVEVVEVVEIVEVVEVAGPGLPGGGVHGHLVPRAVVA